LELVRRKRPAGGGVMARPTHVYTIEYVATLIGENLELLEEIASNSDNIDYGEMIHVYDGTDEGSTTFTDRGIETCRSSLPTCAPGKAAFANSFSTSNVIRKRSNASWQMSQNHKPRGLGRMVTEEGHVAPIRRKVLKCAERGVELLMVGSGSIPKRKKRGTEIIVSVAPEAASQRKSALCWCRNYSARG
jgi:hypothetical protein